MQIVSANINPPEKYSHLAMRVIAHWAFIEFMLQGMAHDLLGLDAKRGRIAVRDPRPDEYPKMFRQLLELAEIQVGPVTDVYLRELPGTLKEYRAARDLLAHGVWAKNPDTGGDVIRNVNGSWPETKEQKSISRRIVPEAVPVTEESLEHVRECMYSLIAALHHLRTEVARAMAMPAPKLVP